MDDYDSVSKEEEVSENFVSSLNTNKNVKESVSLSSLTAKYNRTFKQHAISGGNVEVTQKRFPVYVSNSSDDECSDSEFSGSSLAAMLVKHKANKKADKPFPNWESNSTSKSEKSGTSDSKLRDSGDNRCSNTELISKHQVFQSTCNPDLPCSQPLDCTSSDLMGYDYSNTNMMCYSENKLIFKDSPCNLNSDIEIKSEFEEIVSKFRKVSFSDSDSDESFSLSDLARKHTKSVCQVDSGSADNLKNLKPKDVLNIISSHRQHTKSESDSFTSVTPKSLNELMKKGFDNETSTSLDCLGDKVSNKDDFNFSLGCKLPVSYKSNKIGNGLYSSLSCIKASKVNINSNNSLSDSDVRKYKCESTIPINSPSKVQNKFLAGQHSTASINLSTAIKSLSSTKGTDPLTVENTDDQHDIECDEIVTLLDTMIVDEEIGEDAQVKNCELPSFNNELHENCSFDASDILKVKLKLQTRKCSMFGKIVCKKWKALRTPYIKKERKIVTTVVPFQFTTKSPDDQTWQFLERRKPL